MAAAERAGTQPRIIAFPAEGIAYNDGLYAAFAALDTEVVEGRWGGRWLLETLRPQDVIHIHWPSFLYSTPGPRWVCLLAFLRFTLLLGLAKLRCREIWWTAHNLLPHVPNPIPALDLLARRFVIQLARHVFVHGEHARQVLVERFPSAAPKTVCIPHGHWIDFYPRLDSSEQARQELQLPQDAFVYLQFGQCKPYKNLDGTVQAFRSLPDERLVLLIAGHFSDATYFDHICQLAAGDARIRVENRFIPDDQLAAYLLACDVMCMPYREILTSGTAMLALSHGKPVLSMRKGFLRDVIDADCGILIESTSPENIAEAMQQMAARRWDSSRIVEHARQFSFETAARLSLACLSKASTAEH
ncbi:glycosyltransferase [Burkholderiaceae bacterium UC74_6]